MIDLDPHYFNDQITNTLKKNLKNFSKLLIGDFKLQYYKSFNTLLKNEKLIDEIKTFDQQWIKEDMDKYFDILDKAINVNNNELLEDFLLTRSLSNILLKEAVEENDIGLIYDSFSQFRSKLCNHEFCDWVFEYGNISKTEEIKIKITVSDKSEEKNHEKIEVPASDLFENENSVAL